jgi:hypothetical protein
LLVVVAGAMLAAPGAADAERNAPPSVGESRLSEPAPRSRDADDAGRFLAGLPGRSDSPFASLEAAPAWRIHRGELNRAWKRFEAFSVVRMRDFEKRELSASGTANRVVFYPFSGPDTLMATVFSPRSPVYVMIGLEPPGTLPTPSHFARRELIGHLTAIRSSVHSALHRTFFITGEMNQHFRGQVCDGLFAPILHLLVRTNHTVLGWRYVGIDDGGRIVERAARARTPNPGIQVDFSNDADNSIHSLYYFSVNLADSLLSKNKPFLAFLGGLKDVSTLLKATSYMTHRRDFSVIRDKILEKSAVVLQDDSGVPYRYFQGRSWRIKLYGGYSQPYGTFAGLVQPDLRKAYQTAKAQPLSFGIGYGYGRIPSNLLYATRLNSPVTQRTTQPRSAESAISVTARPAPGAVR